MSHGHGNSIHIRTFESFAGLRFGELAGEFSKAVLLGVVRPHGEAFRPILNPSEDLTLESEDRLVFLAQGYEDCEILKNQPPKQSSHKSQDVSHTQVKDERHILILGWNHKAAALLKELGRYAREQFEISILSLIPSAEREAELRRKGIDQHRVKITHCEGDHTSLLDLEALHPSSYDNVVILGSDWLETQEESDARTIVGHLVLKNILEGTTQRPKVLVDLMDADNVGLFQDENTEVLVTPMIVSHVLAQVALRRELNVVYAELFGAGGAEIYFRTVADYGIVGQKVSFGKLKDISADRGEIVCWGFAQKTIRLS